MGKKLFLQSSFRIWLKIYNNLHYQKDDIREHTWPITPTEFIFVQTEFGGSE